MAVQKLPSDRWRATVSYKGKRYSPAEVLGLDEKTFSTKKAAQRACIDAEDKLREREGMGDAMTVASFREWWLRDPMFVRKGSTMKTYERGTARFAEQFGHLNLHEVDHRTVRAYRSGYPTGTWTLPYLRTLFADAIAQRLSRDNPFVGLKLPATKGNAEVEPPSVSEWWELSAAAWDHTPPGFAAWFQFAAWTGMRPGEVDAITHSDLSGMDGEVGRAHVWRQFSQITRTFASPKNGKAREVLVFPPAIEALRRLAPVELDAAAADEHRDYLFCNSEGHHWQSKARERWWAKVRKATGCEHTLYMATRHFHGFWLYELERHPAEDVAIQLGHTDRGDLVRRVYGHHRPLAALDRLASSAGSSVPRPALRSVA